jgi:hypothetical protein
LIYGYEAEDYPVMDLIDAFVHLAAARVELGPIARAEFQGLIHPVHQEGVVVAWEILRARGEHWDSPSSQASR